MELTFDYKQNVALTEEILRWGKNFDILEKRLKVAQSECAFFYVDGFVKDGELQRVMQYLLSRKELGTARDIESVIPYAEVGRTSDLDALAVAVLSGQTALFAQGFGNEAILIDLRTYPARTTSEPEGDRVMQGARDGFVETLIMNTALLRRRVRDPRLVMKHFDMGGSSHTDVVVSYIDGVADAKKAEAICKRISSAEPSSLTLGQESLAEILIPKGWLNPFPKIRTTERPDTASSEILEGKILVFCDTSPEVMILPTSIFDFCEEADDYCFPPLTGSYLRILRIAILLLSMVATPLWYLAIENEAALPGFLKFLIPNDPGTLPIILQLFLGELALDGLKLASMNTPNMLSNSLSVVGALILGDFAVEVGWFSTDVIFYMACVAIAAFAQQNQQLGFAFKFIRMLNLALVYFFGAWGLLIGGAVFALLVATNRTAADIGGYLYPLFPFDGKIILKHLVRFKKKDFKN